MKVNVYSIFSKEGNKAAKKIAGLTVKNKSVLKQVLEGATSENKRVKNASAKCLREVSRTNPNNLYPQFNFFMKLVDGDDTILKWNAIEVLANLIKVDVDINFKTNQCYRRHLIIK